MNARWVVLSVVIVWALGSRAASAQVCPPQFSEASLDGANNALDLYRQKGMFEAGARCAQNLFSRFSFAEASVSSKTLKFLDNVGFLQRRAAEKRTENLQKSKKAGLPAPPDPVELYQQEVEIRSRIIGWLLAHAEDAKNKNVQGFVDQLVQQISYRTSAAASIKDYKGIAEFLPTVEPHYIEPVAARTWLQAVWSCDAWDGVYANICNAASTDVCASSASVFLKAAKTMRDDAFANEAFHVEQLKKVVGGCLAQK